MTLTENSRPASGVTPRGVFARVAAFAHRRRWLVLLLWVAVLAGIWGAACAVGDDYREDYSLPGTQSQRAADLLAVHGSGRAADNVQIVLSRDAGLSDSSTRKRVEGMLARVAALPTIEQVRARYADPSAIAPGGRIGYATAALKKPAKQMERADAERIHEIARSASGDGLQVELGGDVARLLADEQGGLAEGAGLLAALVILLLMFGSVTAAGLPIVTALFAVGSTLGAIVVASHLFMIAAWTPYVMMLVGLGVGIDYALLVFARYRAELLNGTSPERAAVTALDQSGRTVFFAGGTVILALLGLVALGLGSLQGMALSVALTVLVTMLASLTLLPAMLGFFGERFARTFTQRAARRGAKGRTGEGAVWRRIGALVQRRPLAALLAGGALLVALAAPMLGMRLGFADAGNDAPSSTSRKAYDLLSEGFGPGFNGPLLLVTEGGRDGASQAAGDASRVLGRTAGVKAVTAPRPSGDGRIATVTVFPTTSPQARETADLLLRLRGSVLPAMSAQTGASFALGGPTAATEDYSDKVAGRMPLFVAIVVGLSLILLLAVFRSVLIPLKAALLNLLSIGAALGAMTLVFQHGLLGVEPAPIEAYLPVMVFAVVFGLSMDYEIFLVSRMREEWRRTGDVALAVREGLAHTGSLVTAAGAIMIAVFGAFMLSPQRLLQQTGFGMAVAIFVDAVVIRCLIVPAAMRLLGRRAWWLPRPLARILPRLDVEKH
ncbi:MMPL family transporter [Actinomadura verrucosospora]|uniref:MMPL domain protein n=1 Tax=Actinomadura verrucosospora TaxID=46165 RepID=A0A7D3VPA9_ACTVE|nr:MMPL family transporter [Actinomadura verrucosospora]QKG18639.1 MMPL domain protein [Actinomadura verrucosospora]